MLIGATRAPTEHPAEAGKEDQQDKVILLPLGHKCKACLLWENYAYRQDYPLRRFACTGMTTDPRMTAAWLRAFLQEQGVRRPDADWDLDDKVLKLLAVDIFVRVEHHQRPPPSHPGVEAYANATETRNLAEEIIGRLEKLRVADTLALAEVQAEQASLLVRADQPHTTVLAGWHALRSRNAEQIAHSNAQIGRLTTAIEGLAGLTPYLKGSLLGPPKTTWQRHAVDLAKHFVRRLRECNRNSPTGISKAKGNPTVTFVRVVSELITGERPTQGNVAKFLGEHLAEIQAKPDAGE